MEVGEWVRYCAVEFPFVKEWWGGVSTGGLPQSSFSGMHAPRNTINRKKKLRQKAPLRIHPDFLGTLGITVLGMGEWASNGEFSAP